MIPHINYNVSSPNSFEFMVIISYDEAHAYSHVHISGHNFAYCMRYAMSTENISMTSKQDYSKDYVCCENGLTLTPICRYPN